MCAKLYFTNCQKIKHLKFNAYLIHTYRFLKVYFRIFENISNICHIKFLQFDRNFKLKLACKETKCLMISFLKMHI